MKKLTLSFLAICISVISSLFTFAPLIVHAQTFTIRTPNFSLYSNTPEVIASGEVSYDTTLFSPTDGTVAEHSVYHISATAGQTLNFSIPFLSSAIDLPPFDVEVNGKAVNGSVYYGDSIFDFSDNFDYTEAISKVRSSELDSSASGTIYVIRPTDSSFTVHLKRQDEQALIYESAGRQTSTSDSGGLTLTMESTRSEFVFYVTNGDFSEFSIIGAEYDREPLSHKDFVDRYYLLFQEFYDQAGAPPIEFFYSLMNIASERYTYNFDDFFFSSYTTRRCNTYNFSIVAESEDVVITYDTLATVQPNNRFSPIAYLVEQIRTTSCPIEYSFELSVDYPYLLESSTKATNSGNRYTVTVSEGNFYYIFCSEKRPTDLYATANGLTTLQIVLIVIACVAGAGLIISVTLIIVSYIKAKRRE